MLARPRRTRNLSAKPPHDLKVTWLLVQPNTTPRCALHSTIRLWRRILTRQYPELSFQLGCLPEISRLITRLGPRIRRPVICQVLQEAEAFLPDMKRKECTTRAAAELGTLTRVLRRSNHLLSTNLGQPLKCSKCSKSPVLYFIKAQEEIRSRDVSVMV